MIAVLIAVFVLSGAAGLIYESIWSRYLGLFVGHSAYAQIIVLVIFLGGMSLGAHVAGRRSSRWRSPLLWYAGVELVVGFLALVFHDVYTDLTALAYRSIFPSLAGVWLTAAKWSIASALILPQSILLGATFPLMSAGVLRLARAEEAPGRLLGLLYFANSLGAAVGVLLAGFVLVATVGLPGTLLVAGVLNVFAAVVVAGIARSSERAAAAAANASAPPTQRPTPFVVSPVTPAPVPYWRLLLWISFGTAVASFIYEIAWIRMLSLVLGSATHSFELMLSAFILGLALGAWWIRSRIDSMADPVRFLGIVQWAMGILAVATLPLYLASFEWIATMLRTLQQNENGYRAFLVGRYVVALLVMLPATFCAGMTLPVITRVLMRGGAGERAIGTVYAVNTLGAIAGVILAALVLMPLLGLKRLLVFGAVIDIGLGIWLLMTPRESAGTAREAVTQRRFFDRSPFGMRPSLAIPVLATALLLSVVAGVAQFDLARLTSGVYRHGVVTRSQDYTFPFYRDGRTATVSMRRSADGFMTLSTNGKPDASMESAWLDTADASGQRTLDHDIATQFLLPFITLAHAPLAQHAAVIGHGSGMSSHVLLGSPYVRQVVTIEIEPEMVRASRFFRPANARVFSDPRSTFVIDDAKSYFASSGRKFDLILSEPSNPWVSGVSGLFTREFYERVKDQLSGTGVFGQWLHLYEISDALVNSVLTAIDHVFSSYEVFYTSNADILIVAARDTLPAPLWRAIYYPGIAHDLRHVVPFGDESFEALRVGGREVLRPMLMAYGVPNSDFFPMLDLGAERVRFMKETAEGYVGLASRRFNVPAAIEERRAGFGSRFETATPEIPRAVALALGARMRAVRSGNPLAATSLQDDQDLRSALFGLDQLQRMSATSRPPVHWNAWAAAVVRVDEDIHGGTAGVVDDEFFDMVRGFAARTGAPPEARAAVDFLHGLGAWNWPEAAAAARVLMTSRDSLAWIQPALLRNGAAVAHIKLGDHEAAKEVLRHFAARTREDRFGERLISAYLIYKDPELREKMGWDNP